MYNIIHICTEYSKHFPLFCLTYSTKEKEMRKRSQGVSVNPSRLSLFLWVHEIFHSLLCLHLSLGLQFDLISKISPQFCSLSPLPLTLPPVGLCVYFYLFFIFFLSSLGALRRLRNRHLSWIWPSLPTRKGSREHHMSYGRSTEPFVYTFGNADWWMILIAGSE